MNDYDLPVSAFPSDIVFTPTISQDIANCPIQCQARSTLFPTRTPDYVLQFDSESGQMTFSWSKTDQVGNQDTFTLTCTSILSILNHEMRTAQESVVINFVDGSDVSGLIILDDGTVLEGSRNGRDEDGTTNKGNPDYGNQDCENDRIWLLTDFTIVDYFVSSRSTPVILKPSFIQHLNGCPISCTLDESMTGGIVQTDLFDLSESGEVTIFTLDESRAGDVQMKLVCTSTESL